MSLSVRTLVATILLWGSWAIAQQSDLRERYGTRSLETAEHIDRGIKSAQSKHPVEALNEVNAALGSEPQCQMALYWKGLILGQLGDVDQAVLSFEKAIDLPSGRSPSITVDAAINAGLLLAQIERGDESNIWMSRAILEDPEDQQHMRWKAWRNMAVTLHRQHKDFSASLAAELAREADPQHVDERMADAFRQQAGNQETARVLFFKNGEAAPTKRDHEAGLATVELGGDTIADKVSELWPDPRGQFTVVIIAGANYYYLVEGKEKLTVRRIPVEAKTACGCLIAGKLYLAVSNPLQLWEVEIQSGKPLRRVAIHGPAPDTVAVFPSKSVAFYPVSGHIHRVDLNGGSDEDVRSPGQFVRSDPAERFLYSYIKPPPRGMNEDMILINGRPIFIRHNGPVNWTQTTLFQYVVTSGKLLLAQVRENASSNGGDLAVSPDGNWVSVAGGGGWRSDDPANKSGYVIPVYGTKDFELVQGPFSTDAYPLGLAVNPVTNQVAAIRAKDVHLYDLAGGSGGETLFGVFSGRSAWTGDGRYLFLSNVDGGLTVYGNTLSAEEAVRGEKWWKSVLPDQPPTAPSRRLAKRPDGLKSELTAFKISDARDVVRTAVNAAITIGAHERLTPWSEVDEYNSDRGVMQTARELERPGTDAQSGGVRIYKLRKAIEKSPSLAPLQLFLADALRTNGQTDAARDAYLNAIHEDAGRSDTAQRALNGLAVLLIEQKQESAAAFCLANAMSLDRDNPRTLSLMRSVLQSLKFDDELGQLNHAAPAAGRSSVTGLRPLPPPPEAKTLTGPQLFQQVVGSVVLIRCGDSSGTGICVSEPGLILTNQHVIAGGGAIEVTTFILKDGTPQRFKSLNAVVVTALESQDLAVIRVADAPASLTPLPVAAGNPRIGQRVFTVGNPGLGDRILEQTMSEGIVSATGRVIRGQDFIQHTAAVNPGNSGGPLLDETGQVVGVITLQAALENVSFAIPASRVRQVFEQGDSQE